MTSSAANTLNVSNYTNPKGISTYAIQNGTGNVAFADSHGLFSVGTFINATQVNVPAYPNDLATFTASGVTWGDLTIWTNAAQPAITITATDANGVTSQLQETSMTTLVGLSGPLAGQTGTRSNDEIFWSNGQIWVGFDPDGLNAFFEMGTTYP